MAFLPTLRGMAYSALGAPRLYAAGRRAGASPIEAVRMLHVTGLALPIAAVKGAGVPGRVNAVRHFIWQAALTARHGGELANALADEQERGTPNADDSAVDRHNNAVGQAFGAADAGELQGLSPREALTRLATVALAKWDAGELHRVR